MNSDLPIDIRIASDVEYNKLIAEIYYKGKFFALISQEEGPEDLKVVFCEDIFKNVSPVHMLEFDWLINSLKEAKELLIGGSHSHR